MYLAESVFESNFLKELVKEVKFKPIKSIGENPEINPKMFNSYVEELYQVYCTNTSDYEIVGIEDYKKQIKEKEVLALKSVSQYVDFFESKYQTEFLGYCEEFIHWLDDSTIKIDAEMLERLEKIGSIQILKSKYAGEKINSILEFITDPVRSNYYRIGMLIKLGVYDEIKKNIKRKDTPSNPNRTAKELSPIFDYKQTSIEPIIRAYEDNNVSSINYPLKEKTKNDIEESLKNIGIQQQ